MTEVSKDGSAAVWRAGLKPTRGNQESGVIASRLTGELAQGDAVVGQPRMKEFQLGQFPAIARRSVGDQFLNGQQGPLVAPDNVTVAIAHDMAALAARADQATIIERAAETPLRLSDIVPVYSKREFFDLVYTDNDFRSQIAGVTGTSASHILKGFDPRGIFAFPLYQDSNEEHPYIRMLLSPQLTDKVLDEESGFDSIDEILTLANQYSDQWALREIASENGFGPLIGENVYAAHIIATVLNDTYSPPSFIRRPQEEIDSWEKIAQEERLALFGSQEVYDDIISQKWQKGGVLAVYGDAMRLSGFLEELMDKGKLIPGDNADQNTAKIYESIPAELIMALVPMGEYEEEILLKG